MGKINQYNYYPFQELDSSRLIIEKMLSKRRRLKTIFRFLRSEARWDAIGNFPILSFIVSVSRLAKYQFSEEGVARALGETEEFKNIRSNNQLIQQICASVTLQNHVSGNKKSELDKGSRDLKKGKL